MQNLYYEVGSLDRRCYETLGLSEDILMEQAATHLALEIKKRAKKEDTIIFVCGPGNNGADGIACARMLQGDFSVVIYAPFGLKSPMALLQQKRANALHVEFLETLSEASIYVDCLFGSGFRGSLDTQSKKVIEQLNRTKGLKIACDIPSGINADGIIDSICFVADLTITMGALKEALYSDNAKDAVGEILLANLGISRSNYEVQSDTYLLEKSDLRLPLRNKKATHKGSYGHVGVLGGEKEGASVLCATAAFSFGAGLVSIVSERHMSIPPFVMHTALPPATCNTLVAGMGLGDAYDDKELEKILLAKHLPLVVDADLFYADAFLRLLLKRENVIFTPHPKEFAALLHTSGVAQVSVEEIQAQRFKWAKAFAQQYPNIVLVLKGANTIITKADKLYVNPLGSAKLAKGGSGDVLAGLIAALVAQNYSLVDACVSASLAHAIAAKNIYYADFGLNPLDLCEGIKWL